jgi:hypothetical protein
MIFAAIKIENRNRATISIIPQNNGSLRILTAKNPRMNCTSIEAVFNERFSGWVEKVDGIGNLWSMCVVKPTP